MFWPAADMKYDSMRTAKLPYLVLEEPWKGVPRKSVPMVQSAISLAASSVPWGWKRALATTRPPRLCATNMMGRSVQGERRMDD